MALHKLTQHLVERLQKSGLTERIVAALGTPDKKGVTKPAVAGVRGPKGPDLTFLAAAAALERKAPLLLITTSKDASEHHADDLYFLGFEDVFHVPSWDLLPFEMFRDKPGVESQAKRLDALARLTRDDKPGNLPPMFTMPIEALVQKTVPPAWFKKKQVVVEWGSKLDIAGLTELLLGLGYTETGMVEARGEFTVRGGVIDIFPLDADHALRLDLFGNDLEAIRRFDIGTQRSLPGEVTLEKLVLSPADEAGMLQAAVVKGEQLVSILDFFPDNTVVAIEGVDQAITHLNAAGAAIDKELEKFAAGKHEWTDPTGKHRKQPVASDWYAATDEILQALRRRPAIECARVVHAPISGDPRPRTEIELHARTFEDIKPDLDVYLGVLRARQAEDYTVGVVCDNVGQVQRLEELLKERSVATARIDLAKGGEGFRTKSAIEGFSPVLLMVGDLTAGFILPEIRAMLVTDREIFGRYRRRHVYRKLYKGTAIQATAEIERGDYVVHVEHGIAVYQGLRRQTIDGGDVDLIELLYRDDDKLLVPVDRIRYIQKYTRPEGITPTLDKLGGAKWKARKNKTAEQVEAMANDLLELYAARESAEGYAFPIDNVNQQQFEASFLYQETPDQLTAISQVKDDLERPRPMDRLVCGDVGYGKTEVAIRAAFKAIQAGRQVALLCPTTILAQQHYNTFKERFADFGVKVEQLSRFADKKDVSASLKRLASGESLMAVGTHRLLSKDVKFVDLGLLIIDEEQRFGVNHKETFKRLRTELDVLTLSATPIPRTLYMAMSGLRDMSMITTPPADRYPIRTRVIRFDKDAIEEAIRRELNRGGQVYFIHNRIHNIQEVADRLQEIIPNLRLAIGHGQMHEDELEEVMSKFIEGDIDVLLATSIVENGLDIPNCNTIIVNRADAFGLAQLYQLRGRVGRSNRQAYAYLIVPEGMAMSEAAIKRIDAIEQFSELGVGFQIAMRDLEIRGTGNILGREQHGAMEAIGFDLYCQMLEDAVKRLRGTGAPRPAEVDVSWRCAAHLPVDYIPLEAQRFDVYRRLANARETIQIDDLEAELRDRFGKVPEPVDNLMKITKLRVLASQAGVAKLGMTADGFRLDHADPLAGMAIWAYLEREHPGVEKAEFSNATTINVKVAAWAKGSRLGKAIKLLTAFINAIDKVNLARPLAGVGV